MKRRAFIQATGAGLAFPTIIPSTAIGRGGRPAPSERITMAAIGFGTIAHNTARSFLNDERVQTVAVCDVNKISGSYGYKGELEGGREYGRRVVNEFYAEKQGKDPATINACAAYEDYREVYARDDIDAVNISTPDHWHGILVVEAARAGKHIYGQKPLSLTIAQGRAMADAVKAAGVTFQAGSQQRSSVYFRRACELVRNGYLGKVHTVRAILPCGHNDWSQRASQKDPAPVPDGLNWDMWLGPAPKREFAPALHPLNWRHNYDFSGGMVTDFGAHHIDIGQWALDMDHSGPVRFFNPSVTLPPVDDLYNTATEFRFEAEYASGVRLVVESTMEKGAGGVRFEGENGKWIFAQRGVTKSNPPEIWATRLGDNDVRLYESNQHEVNFIDCIYSGAQPVAPIEAAHRTISIAHIGNILLRLGRDELRWNPAKEQFIGDKEANSWISRKMRAPWKI
jgi:predicted dehydrogenase